MTTMINPASRKTLRRIMTHLRPHRLRISVSLGCALLCVILTLRMPVLIGQAVDVVLGPNAVDFSVLTTILTHIALATIGTALCQWAMNRQNNTIVYETVRDIRKLAFEKLQIVPLSYLDAHPMGETLNRLTTDVDQFSEGLLMGFTQLFTGVITIIFTLVIMFNANGQIALAVIFITPISLLVAAVIAKRSYDLFSLQSVIRAEQNALVDEAISGQKTVRAFGCEHTINKKFDDVSARLEACSLKAIFVSAITQPATRFVNALVYTTVAIVGAWIAISGGISVGALTALLSYATQYTKPFNEISGVVTEMQNAIACLSRVLELIDETPQTPEPADAFELTDPKGCVTLNDVSFSYNPKKPLIEHFDLSVDPGQRIAIVGPTGCGKTTLINLLMRFYDVNGGTISVDNHDIRDVTRKSLRKSYGMVLQETWLKHGTIYENITLGNPDVTQDMVVEAAKLAHAHAFIRRLPNGYDTQINEAGGGLSQGQKQLLCIARVMLIKPNMLILDEATSSIDTRTEHKIQDAFSLLMRGRTSFIVAHRLSTIKSADRILVMRDGHIIELGDHNSLLKQDGFYATLYKSQFAH